MENRTDLSLRTLAVRPNADGCVVDGLDTGCKVRSTGEHVYDRVVHG